MDAVGDARRGPVPSAAGLARVLARAAARPVAVPSAEAVTSGAPADHLERRPSVGGGESIATVPWLAAVADDDPKPTAGWRAAAVGAVQAASDLPAAAPRRSVRPRQAPPSTQPTLARPTPAATVGAEPAEIHVPHGTDRAAESGASNARFDRPVLSVPVPVPVPQPSASSASVTPSPDHGRIPEPVAPVVIGRIEVHVDSPAAQADPFAGCRAVAGGLTARRGGGW